MTYVIRAAGFANGSACPHAGQWLKEFDPDACGGQGYCDFTDNVDHAMRFKTQLDAFVLWGKQSKVRPLRPDGKPNKPLTALTVEIEELV